MPAVDLKLFLFPFVPCFLTLARVKTRDTRSCKIPEPPETAFSVFISIHRDLARDSESLHSSEPSLGGYPRWRIEREAGERSPVEFSTLSAHNPTLSSRRNHTNRISIVAFNNVSRRRSGESETSTIRSSLAKQILSESAQTQSNLRISRRSDLASLPVTTSLSSSITELYTSTICPRRIFRIYEIIG